MEGNLVPGVAVNVTDFFRIDDEGNHVSEPLATLVGYELQDGATAEFLKLWRRRPRELNYQIGGPEPGYLCVLRSYTATLEDEPSRYIEALNVWLLDHGYTFQERR